MINGLSLSQNQLDFGCWCCVYVVIIESFFNWGINIDSHINGGKISPWCLTSLQLETFVTIKLTKNAPNFISTCMCQNTVKHSKGRRDHWHNEHWIKLRNVMSDTGSWSVEFMKMVHFITIFLQHENILVVSKLVRKVTKNATWRWREHTCQWHDFIPELQSAVAIMLPLAKKALRSHIKFRSPEDIFSGKGVHKYCIVWIVSLGAYLSTGDVTQDTHRQRERWTIGQFLVWPVHRTFARQSQIGCALALANFSFCQSSGPSMSTMLRKR